MSTQQDNTLNRISVPAPSLKPINRPASTAAQRARERMQASSIPTLTTSDPSGEQRSDRSNESAQSDLSQWENEEQESPFEDGQKTITSEESTTGEVPQETPQEQSETVNLKEVVSVEAGEESGHTFPLFTAEDMMRDVQSIQKYANTSIIITLDQWVRSVLNLEPGDEPWNRKSDTSFGSHHIHIFITWSLVGFTPTYEMLEEIGFDQQKIESILTYLRVLGQLRSQPEKIVVEKPQPVSSVSEDVHTEGQNSSITDRLLLLMLQGLTGVEGFPASLTDLKEMAHNDDLIRQELDL